MPGIRPEGQSRPCQRTRLRECFNALRNPPPFLRQIWATSPALTLATLGMRIARAFLPIARLYVGKLIIDEAVRLVGMGIDWAAARYTLPAPVKPKASDCGSPSSIR